MTSRQPLEDGVFAGGWAETLGGKTLIDRRALEWGI
jgi:hypothetical protein